MKRIISITVIVLIITVIAFTLPKEKPSKNVKIGVSDDISGFVVDYMTQDKKHSKKNTIEPYFIKDC